MVSSIERFDLHPHLHLLKQTNEIKALQTILRSRETERQDFAFYADRLIRLVIEEGLNFIPFVEKTVTTPTGRIYKGTTFGSSICGISVVRAGEAMERGLRAVCKSVRIGKILIQRDEETAKPQLYYFKLPEDLQNRFILLMDPVIGTGGSALQALNVLREHGVEENRIIFTTLLSTPEGVQEIAKKYPNITILTSSIEQGLNEKMEVVPGLGDFGNRYWGTTKPVN